MVSFGSCLSGLIATVLLSLYGCFFLKHARRSVYWDLRVLILLFLVAGARMLLPVNLPLNYSYYSHTLLVPISIVAFYVEPHTHLFLAEILGGLLLTVSVFLLVRRWREHRRFREHVHALTKHDAALDGLIAEHTASFRCHKAAAVYIDAPVSPFVFGLLHPTIVLPVGVYTDEELGQILEHELTHIRQHDLLVKEVFGVLTALFWWNPFMWILRRQLDDAIELSNDVALYQRMGETDKLDYASLLVKTAGLSGEADTKQALALSTHSDPILQRRVREILDTHSPQKPLLVLHLCVMLVIVGASFVVTPEPHGISEEQARGTFDLEEDLGATSQNTFILDKGDHYELYVDGKFMGRFQEITEDFRAYPVYKEAPGTLKPDD